MRVAWANPAVNGSQQTPQDVIFVSTSASPAESPAPAGDPTVPEGWVRQIGADGRIDTMQVNLRPDDSIEYRPNDNIFCVPYFTGGWPPDPLYGQPGHTPQCPTGAG